ncbi:MAG TPA: hypothetical protein ENK75_05625 [Saprospiraceae bacterium]|nr:hypothetical protein [Saprospiraceae bacterium]HHH54039.1 hypothetical protein [Bacteroidota bacterium]
MKNKNFTYRFLAIFVAAWILFISSGVVVDFHYCQGKIKHFAFYSEAQSCHTGDNVCPMHKKSCGDESSCKMHNGDKNEDNCCHNEKKVIKLPVKYTFDKPAVQKTIDFAIDNSNFIVKTNNYNFHKSYKIIYVDRPPPVDTDFQSLFQSYLL